MQDAAASGPHFGGKHTLREALLLRWKSGCWFELRHGIALRGKVICEWCVEWVGRGGGVLTRDDGFSGERGGVLVFSRVEICHPGPALGIAGGLVGRASAVRKLRRGGLALAD